MQTKIENIQEKCTNCKFIKSCPIACRNTGFCPRLSIGIKKPGKEFLKTLQQPLKACIN